MKKILSVLLSLISIGLLSITAFADVISPWDGMKDIVYDPTTFFSSVKNIIITCGAGAGILALVAVVLLYIIKNFRS